MKNVEKRPKLKFLRKRIRKDDVDKHEIQCNEEEDGTEILPWNKPIY